MSGSGTRSSTASKAAVNLNTVYIAVRKKAMERTVRVTPKKLNIVEGSYSMHPTLADHYDLRVFLTVEAEEQSRRILRRNRPAMHNRFMEEWVPMENRYFREFGIASKCDIVI